MMTTISRPEEIPVRVRVRASVCVCRLGGMLIFVCFGKCVRPCVFACIICVFFKLKF